MNRYNIPEENFYAIYACNKHVDETIFFSESNQLYSTQRRDW